MFHYKPNPFTHSMTLSCDSLPLKRCPLSQFPVPATFAKSLAEEPTPLLAEVQNGITVLLVKS